MNFRIKKLLTGALATAMLITSSSFGSLSLSTVSAEATDTYATSGTWGTDGNGKWVLSEDGTLLVTGNGEVTNVSPRCKFGKDVNRLVLGEGITKIAIYNLVSDTNNLTEMVLPSTFSGDVLGNCQITNDNYPLLKNVYIYSKNIVVTKSGSGYLPKPGSGVVMHLYKDSDTEKCFRSLFDYTDEDIVYIEGERPADSILTPAVLPEVTETSGPSGLNSKWEYNTSNNTLTFSGKGTISIADDYKKYAPTTEHIVIGEGIIKINANTGQVYDNTFIVSQAFYGFSAVKDVKLPDTLKEIGEGSFYQTPITKIDLPSSLETIGRMAFKYSNLEEISFPESLKEIGEGAFSFSKIKSINLHEGMTIGGGAFSNCESLKDVIIPKNVFFERTAGGGQGMAREHGTFSGCTRLESITFEDGSVLVDTWRHVQTENGIGESFCLGCTSLKTVIIKGNIDCIMAQAFKNCSSLNNIYFYNKGLYTITAKGSGSLLSPLDSIDLSNNPTFHIYKGSATETTLRNAGYLTDATDTTKANYVYLVPDDSKNDLDETIKKAESIDTGKCSKDLADALIKAVDEAKSVFEKAKTDPNTSLEEVTKAIESLNNAINNIPADYTSVDKAIANVPKELGKYTDSSVNVLNEALKSVDRTKNITEQDIVDGYAKAINDAIAELKLKPIQHNNANVNLETKKNAEKIMNQAKITSLKVKNNGKRKITVKWKKVNKADGYQVQVSKKKKFKGKNIIFKKKIKGKKLVIKKGKIKSKKVYFVRVRAYKTYQDENGVTKYAYSEWNKKTRKVKVK